MLKTTKMKFAHALRKLGMGYDRYFELEREGTKLTKEELDAGWHYCHEWDEMLIHKSWPEYEACLCFKSQPQESQQQSPDSE